MYKQQRKKRNTQEKFRRRKISLVSKVDDLHRFFGADAFLVIRMRGRYYAYISTEGPYWPPTKEQMEQSYPLPEMKTPRDFDVVKEI
ncbi:hypothetical protein LAWI1_G005274 [Lachnellula willkommii]|uniref:MADS-box domain-containing protein n=1 Tax=Lachnellula willkommii TaxID=215461 RepID=A0A559MB29_9HELO|nr:hypothetical protein LAWI1_G005274 [Lachnellula willkommii]